MTRPSDDALWACAVETLRTVILPALPAGGHAHRTAVQLAGLASYAQSRPPDPTAARTEQLDAALASLAGNRLVPAGGTVAERAAAALAGAMGRNTADAASVRGALRPLLVAHLDDDLAATEGLGSALRESSPGG